MQPQLQVKQNEGNADQTEFHEVYSLLFGEEETPFSDFVGRTRRRADFIRDLSTRNQAVFVRPPVCVSRLRKRKKWRSRSLVRRTPTKGNDAGERLPALLCGLEKPKQKPPASSPTQKGLKAFETAAANMKNRTFDCAAALRQQAVSGLAKARRERGEKKKKIDRALQHSKDVAAEKPNPQPQQRSESEMGINGKPVERTSIMDRRRYYCKFLQGGDRQATKRKRISLKMEAPASIDKSVFEDSPPKSQVTSHPDQTPRFLQPPAPAQSRLVVDQGVNTSNRTLLRGRLARIEVQTRNQLVGVAHTECPAIPAGEDTVAADEGKTMPDESMIQGDKRKCRISPMFYDNARRKIRNLLAKRGLNDPQLPLPVRILLAQVNSPNRHRLPPGIDDQQE